MRRLFFALLFITAGLSPSDMQAQLPTIPIVLQTGNNLGKSEYFVDYTYRYKTTSQSKDSVEDVVRLELGKAFVKSYSYKLWQADSALTHVSSRSASISIPEDGLSPFWYYRDLTSGRTQVWYRTPLAGPTLSYIDTPTFS